ncbi:MAG: FAD-dependent oxidoreductase [Candidatus Methylomirabilales bacterium]
MAGLFDEVRLGPLTLKNRLVMTAMSTCFADRAGRVTGRLTAYYAARARGGVGMVTVEEACLHPRLPHVPNALAAHADAFIPGLASLAGEIHRGGAAASIQLGLYFRPQVNGFPRYAASAEAPDGGPGCLELTPAEIGHLTGLFVAGAERTRSAGFDAVEIHACHGCILSEFLSPFWNKRRDAYGGSREGRFRWAVEILRALRRQLGPDYPVIFRISASEFAPGGFSAEDGLALARALAAEGVTAISLSGGLGHVNHIAIPPFHVPRGLLLPLGQGIRAGAGVPVIVANSLTPELAQQAVARGQADLIGLGRSLIADPEWPIKVAAGRLVEIRRCLRCNQGCLGGLRDPAARGVRCLYNAEVGREGDGLLRAAPVRKRVVVIGGGPAGCEAARASRIRGHEVTLLEKAGSLGGQFALASRSPYKADFTRLVEHYAAELSRLGVDVRLGTPATLETLRALRPDAVLVATGSVPARPPMPGVASPHVTTAHQVLSGEWAVTTGPMVVLGGGATGLETAEYLAGRGLAVTVVEMLEAVGRDIQAGLGVRESLLERLAARGVRILTGRRAERILPDAVEISDRPLLGGGRLTLLPAAAVVLALGQTPGPHFAEWAAELGAEWHVIGDCWTPGNAMAAIHAGFEVATRV